MASIDNHDRFEVSNWRYSVEQEACQKMLFCIAEYTYVREMIEDVLQIVPDDNINVFGTE
ncbi:hypothetical protein EAF00_011943 [Botryotinia globosa]|nr:hypothetical protein EAF00_011943 [Botryotinia globosa]